MATTLGETAAAVTAQLGASALAWATGAADVVTLERDGTCGDAATSPLVKAYVPELVRTAARAATMNSSVNLRGLPG
jgi:hypothetical protein